MSATVTVAQWHAELARLTAARRGQPDGMRMIEIMDATGLTKAKALTVLHHLHRQGRLVVTKGLAPNFAGDLGPTIFYRITPERKAAKRR